MSLRISVRKPSELYKVYRPFLRPYDLQLPLNIVNSRCAISPGARFVYFRIPKAANSTTVSALYEAEFGKTEAAKTMKKAYLRPSDLNAQDAQQAREHFFKFSVVRNPYDRFLSAWLDKLERGSPREQAKVSKALGMNRDDPISIDQFLDYLEHHRGLIKDAHWALQTSLIFMPIQELDLIARTENLNEDLPVILDNIFGDTQIVIRTQQQNAHSTGASSRKAELLSDTQKKRVYRLYEKDFDLLKYPSN